MHYKHSGLSMKGAVDPVVAKRDSFCEGIVAALAGKRVIASLI